MPCDPVHPSADPADQHAGVLTPGQRSGEAGFSLIEVMVTIVIIGLLSTVVLLNVLPSRDKAMVEKAKTDIAVLEQAVDTYKLETLSYPRTEDGLDALVSPPASLTNATRFRKEGYIRRLPEDPWGNAYRYAYPGRSSAFDVYSLGADGQPGGEGLDTDIGNWN
jgi:general secretion pathway protein G